MKVKEESEKAGLKLSIEKINHGIQSHHFMVNRREKVEAVTDVISLGSKITADRDCSHENKKHLLLGRKAMTKLDSILKSKDTTLPTTVRLVKATVFPIVMYDVRGEP